MGPREIIRALILWGALIPVAAVLLCAAQQKKGSAERGMSPREALPMELYDRLSGRAPADSALRDLIIFLEQFRLESRQRLDSVMSQHMQLQAQQSMMSEQLRGLAEVQEHVITDAQRLTDIERRMSGIESEIRGLAETRQGQAVLHDQMARLLTALWVIAGIAGTALLGALKWGFNKRYITLRFWRRTGQ